MQNSIQFESGVYRLSFINDIQNYNIRTSLIFLIYYDNTTMYYVLSYLCLILLLYFSADCKYFCACIYLEQWGLLDTCLSPGVLTQAGHHTTSHHGVLCGVSGYQTPLTVPPCLRGHEHLWLILQCMWVMHAACGTSANCKPVKSSLAPVYRVPYIYSVLHNFYLHYQREFDQQPIKKT